MKRVVLAVIGAATVTPLLLGILVTSAIGTGSVGNSRRDVLTVDGVAPNVLAIVTAATDFALERHPGCDADPLLVLAHMSIEWPPGLLGRGRGDAVMTAGGDFLPIIQAYAPVPGPDTDGGAYDASSTSEYAVGPLQQINAFRSTYGLDANDDREISQNNLADATASEIVHACATRDLSGQSLQSPAGRIFEAGHYMLPAYPTSHAATDYGAMVETAYQRFREASTLRRPSLPGTATHVLPVDPELIEDASVLLAPHHGIPAWDFPVATGTTAYAAAGGRVVAAGWGGGCGNGVSIDATDGARYTYCHGIQVLVKPGDEVAAGTPILLTGSTGHSTGPHLHFQITVNGDLVCPQLLLVRWSAGLDVDPLNTRVFDCVA